MGTYISQADLEAYFGASNVAKWSDVDSTGSAVASKVADSISVGEEYVTDRFRDGPYALPFQASGSSLPSVLKRWMVVFAGADLYWARGLQDESSDDADEEQNKIARLTTRKDREMDGYLSGTRRFALVKATSTNVTAPIIG